MTMVLMYLTMTYGFGNMDPADFIDEFWHDVESAVYPDQDDANLRIADISN